MEIMTVKEVAVMLHYSRPYIRRMCKEGKIPYRQSEGSRITFLKEEVERWWMLYHTSPLKTKIQQFRNLHR
jgi:excisionase family DNA binding protein